MEFKIYTCGKMKGTTFNEQMEWRNKLEAEVKRRLTYCDKKATFIHPPYYYNYDNEYHKSEKEIKDYELAKIQECDVVVVNLNHIEQSVGALYELATVEAHNRNGGKHIFIIGIGEKPNHPWIELSLHRIEDTIEEAVEYITEYLLV